MWHIFCNAEKNPFSDTTLELRYTHESIEFNLLFLYNLVDDSFHHINQIMSSDACSYIMCFWRRNDIHLWWLSNNDYFNIYLILMKSILRNTQWTFRILIIISKVVTYFRGGILFHVVRADEFNLTTLKWNRQIRLAIVN